MEFLVFLLIMLAKIIEVSMATVRTVLITKGERTIGSVIGFFEVILWIYIASNVLNNIGANPWKAIFYSLGFAIGNYVGSMIEEKLAIGLAEIQIIVHEESGKMLTDFIREAGFAVTVVKGEGKNFTRDILYVFAPRKKVKDVVDLVKMKEENSVITVSETKPVYGGYGLLKK